MVFCVLIRRDNPLAEARGLPLRTGAQTMLYLTCTMISRVDLAHKGASHAKDWVSVDCGTIYIIAQLALQSWPYGSVIGSGMKKS